MIEGFIWSPRAGENSAQYDDWAFEEGPHSDFYEPASGCTACVAVIQNNKLVVANAGDSRCVISRKGLIFFCLDCSSVGWGFVKAKQLGDMEFKQNKLLPVEKQIVTADLDINTVELCEDDDFVVLACDGIWINLALRC
ncbi:Probable protein phosphatase 2C 11 [Linum grandiflorum]